MGAPQELIAGRYRLQRRIAAGGMGVVWEAHDELLRRSVAVKQLRTTAGYSDEEAELAKQRAMREARITARLHHPHAVPVFDSVEHEGEPCLVMQYVASEPLSALVRRRGGLPVAEVARIGAEVAAALAAAHALGIVHRDVKPGNILIADEDGSAMLSDFGISHALGDATLTSTGFMHGTPAYLAPEVARGEESTFASDVFSLGSTLYAASEGRAPFGEEPNSIAVLHRVASGGFQAPNDSGPLGPLLLQMMVADPEARPTMREVEQRLAALHEQLGEDLASTLPTGTDREHGQEDADQPTAWVPVEHEEAPTLVAASTAATDPEPTPPATTGPDPAPEATTRPSPTLLAAPVATPPSAPPSPPADGDAVAPAVPERRRRRGVLVGVLVAVVLLLVIALGVGLALRTGPQPAPSRSSAAGPSASASSAPASSAPVSSAPASPRPAPTSTPPSRTPTPTGTPSSSPSASASASASAGAVAAIEHYYTLVPGDTSAAWPLMTAAYQSGHAGGRAAYDAFWAEVRSVTATDVRSIGPNQVEATLTYRRASGVEVDDTTFRLVREDGVLKIADSAVR